MILGNVSSYFLLPYALPKQKNILHNLIVPVQSCGVWTNENQVYSYKKRRPSRSREAQSLSAEFNLQDGIDNRENGLEGEPEVNFVI